MKTTSPRSGIWLSYFLLIATMLTIACGDDYSKNVESNFLTDSGGLHNLEGEVVDYALTITFTEGGIYSEFCDHEFGANTDRDTGSFLDGTMEHISYGMGENEDFTMTQST